MPISQCKRRGIVSLEHRTGVGTFEVSCNTWGCVHCRKKLATLVREKIQYGLSVLDQLSFITLTLPVTREMVTRVESGETARYVAEMWRELLRRYSRHQNLRQSQLKWFRVVELTKKKIPHLHILMESSQIRTCRREGQGKSEAWLKNGSVTCCLEHSFAGEWYRLTGACIFDIRPVKSQGIGSYVIKEYITKMYGDNRQEYLRQGFARRYSYSRAWPKLPRMRRIGTIFHAWDRVGYTPMKEVDKIRLKDYDNRKGVFESNGADYARNLRAKKVAKRNMREIRRFENVS